MDDFYSTQMLIALAIGLLATGAIAGVLAGLLGVGGGIVIVPVLFWIFDFLGVPDVVAMHLAVGTSLSTIIATSISSARAHHKRGSIDVDLLKTWAPLLFVGALLGGVAAKFLAADSLTMIFAVIALAVSINMAVPHTLTLAEKLPEGVIGKGVMPGGIGVFSALMGIGGGTLSVPILSAFSFPVHKAVGTAAAFGLIIAIPATLGFIWSGLGVDLRPPGSIGYVSIPAACLIFPTSVLTAPFGSKLAHRLNPAALKRAFAVFLFITALRMLWSIFT